MDLFASPPAPDASPLAERVRPSTLDGDQKGTLDKSEGKITGDSDKLGDATKVATAASYGAMIGGIASGASGATTKTSLASTGKARRRPGAAASPSARRRAAPS